MKSERFGEDDKDNDSGRDEERSRDRSRRGDRQSRFSGGGGGGGRDRDRSPRGRKKTSEDRRVYVSNIAYEYRWQELKDLFREEVGEVSYVELFEDENDKPRGCGIVEFETAELAKKAVEKMHRFDLKGRKLVVKEDFGVERDTYGRLISNSRGKLERNQPPQRQRDDHRNSGMLSSGGGGDSGVAIQWNNANSQKNWGNTYGLSPQFLENLGIQGPLVSRIFVANLDYKVDQKKLKEVFKMAGRILSCELSVDKDGKSRGFGVVEYDHPVEAVQAISLLHNQVLYDRRLTVRLDRAEKDGITKLPEGLKSLGLGLGSNGAPLQDVARNLPSLSLNNNIGSAVNIASAVPAPFAAAAALGPSAAALGVAGNQLGNLGLGSLATTAVNLGNAGVERFLDNTARRQIDLGSGGLGNPAGLGNVMGGGGAGDLGLGVTNAGYSTGLGSGAFGNNQLAAQNNFMNNSGGGNNMAASRDFDPLSAALTGGFNNANAGMGNAGNNTNSNQMTDAICVRNLPPNVTWQQLKDKFGDAGEVKYAEIRAKDMGLVKFSSQWEANRAINLFDRNRWEGRNLEVRFY